MAFATVHTTKCKGYNVATQQDDETGAWRVATSKGNRDVNYDGATYEEARDAMRADLGYAPQTAYSPDCE